MVYKLRNIWYNDNIMLGGMNEIIRVHIFGLEKFLDH